MTGLYEKLKIYEGLSHPRNDEKNWFILRFILRVGFIKETYKFGFTCLHFVQKYSHRAKTFLITR